MQLRIPLYILHNKSVSGRKQTPVVAVGKGYMSSTLLMVSFSHRLYIIQCAYAVVRGSVLNPRQEHLHCMCLSFSEYFVLYHRRGVILLSSRGTVQSSLECPPGKCGWMVHPYDTRQFTPRPLRRTARFAHSMHLS